ncbi:unnamed protein product [Anisakis simplex]|uniref:Uncharacterized protein n=1 Tax=Anisakis simplex TaxID=6269 RepID=A0A3P6NWN5_ANISI|nr:unnamed protein product [Anisakis simplex]
MTVPIQALDQMRPLLGVKFGVMISIAKYY